MCPISNKLIVCAQSHLWSFWYQKSSTLVGWFIKAIRQGEKFLWINYLLLVWMTIKLKSLSPTSYTVLNTVLQQSMIATYPYLRNCWIQNCITILPSLVLKLNSTILETVNFLRTIVHDESFTLLIMQYSCKCCVNKAYLSCETMHL